MATNSKGRLVIIIDVDTDPTIEDPHDVADALLDGDDNRPSFRPGASWTSNYGDVTATMVSAEWENVR